MRCYLGGGISLWCTAPARGSKAPANGVERVEWCTHTFSRFRYKRILVVRLDRIKFYRTFVVVLCTVSPNPLMKI